jgi:hypothetical protein
MLLLPLQRCVAPHFVVLCWGLASESHLHALAKGAERQRCVPLLRPHHHSTVLPNLDKLPRPGLAACCLLPWVWFDASAPGTAKTILTQRTKCSIGSISSVSPR